MFYVFPYHIPILDYLSEIMNQIGDLIGSIGDPISGLIQMIKELFNIDIHLDGFLDILVNAEDMVEFLTGILNDIIGQLSGLVPEEALKELYELLEALLESGELPSANWDDIQYLLYHGTLCGHSVEYLKSCVADFGF